MIRAVDQIRRTDLGARPIPPFAALGPAALPPYYEETLPNGLRVLLVHLPTAPTVHAQLMVPFAGTDPRHGAGAALLARTLFAGTSRRTRLEIDNETALLGGHLAAAVNPERLGIGAMASAAGLFTLLDVIIDAVTDALYPDDEVVQERDQLIEHVDQLRADPEVFAGEALQRHLYGDHPVTRAMPDPAIVATLDPTEIRDLHQALMTPLGSSLVLVGDFDLDQAFAEVEDAAAWWTSPAIAERMQPVPPVTGGDLQVVNFPGAVQSHLLLAAPAVPYTDPRFAALALATAALGGDISSRLSQVIRERKGYCYRIRSALEFMQHMAGMSATMTVSMNTATAKTAAAWSALRAELDRFVAESPEGDELDRVRRHALGSQLTAICSEQHLADTFSGLLNVGLSFDWFATERELLTAVTAEEIAAVACEFFRPARFTGVIVGDAATLAGELSGVDGVRMP
ncbi:M16 family metallopeptidase [Actinophytocola sp.]|uniref:M16 family metallopeptidase n=1 Tax=Actinophytocola sp. TaxID=1872138 RepID=UPI00389AFDDD